MIAFVRGPSVFMAEFFGCDKHGFCEKPPNFAAFFLLIVFQ
jgi:hypothetical protein